MSDAEMLKNAAARHYRHYEKDELSEASERPELFEKFEKSKKSESYEKFEKSESSESTENFESYESTESSKSSENSESPENSEDSEFGSGFFGRRREPKRTSLFYRYFRVTLIIIILANIFTALMFFAFITNYWTGKSINIMRNNVFRVADTAENILNSGGRLTEGEGRLVLCNSLKTVSAAIDADVFITDTKGRIILCRDMFGDGTEKKDSLCRLHGSYVMPKRIVERNSFQGCYMTDRLEGLYDTRHIVTGRTVSCEGREIAAVYAVKPVSAGLGPFIYEMLKMFFYSTIVSFIVSFALAYVFSYGLTKPMHEMSSITKLYARGDFGEKNTVRGNDEISDLAASLNSMADSLKLIEDSRRSFVANVSHELKTPMTSISGFIDGILDGTIPEKDSRYYLKRVSKEIKRLSRLVGTMLNLSKIEAGEEELKYSETELKQLIFEALLRFEMQINEAGIRVEGFDTMKPVRIMADRDMLFQVAYNLFDNAVKFTDKGGIIRVSIFEEKTRATVNISNTGKGISQDDLRRVFERFYKADKARSENTGGVGLGLNLAKNIVELHGGEMRCSSEKDGFTTLSFSLPKAAGGIK